MSKVSSEIHAEYERYFNTLPTNQKFAQLVGMIRFLGGMEMSLQGIAKEAERYAALDFEQSAMRLVSDAKLYGTDEVVTGIEKLVDKHNQESNARAAAAVLRAFGLAAGGAA